MAYRGLVDVRAAQCDELALEAAHMAAQSFEQNQRPKRGSACRFEISLHLCLVQVLVWKAGQLLRHMSLGYGHTSTAFANLEAALQRRLNSTAAQLATIAGLHTSHAIDDPRKLRCIARLREQ